MPSGNAPNELPRFNPSPSAKTPQTIADNTALFRRLRALKASLGFKPDKHELAIILIGACIAEGLDTNKRIVKALGQIGLNEQHVAIILSKGTGDNPEAYHWKRDESGRYSAYD